MILHSLLAFTALIISAMAGTLPAERVNVPPPNPIPAFMESIFDFEITKFEAQAVVLSERNYITFHVKPYPGATPAHCFAVGTTLTHSLTSIPQTWCYPDGHNGTDMNSGDGEASSPPTSGDHIWFLWTMGEDVDTSDPTADGVFGMDKPTGAYLKIVRQVDAHTRDEAMQHVPSWYLQVVGEGMFEHQVFTGPVNFTLPALRFNEVAH